MNEVKHDADERRLVSLKKGDPLFNMVKEYWRYYNHPMPGEKEEFIKWLQYCPNTDMNSFANCIWHTYWPLDQKYNVYRDKLNSYVFGMRKAGLVGDKYAGAS